VALAAQVVQVLVVLVVPAALVVQAVQVLEVPVAQVAVHVQAVSVAVLQAPVVELVPVAVLHVQELLVVAVRLLVHSVAAASQVRLASQSAPVVKSSTISQPQSLAVCRFNSVAVQQFVYLAVHHLLTSQRRSVQIQQLW
jgi:hypothetical protein